MRNLPYKPPRSGASQRCLTDVTRAFKRAVSQRASKEAMRVMLDFDVDSVASKGGEVALFVGYIPDGTVLYVIRMVYFWLVHEISDTLQLL